MLGVLGWLLDFLHGRRLFNDGFTNTLEAARVFRVSQKPHDLLRLVSLNFHLRSVHSTQHTATYTHTHTHTYTHTHTHTHTHTCVGERGRGGRAAVAGAGHDAAAAGAGDVDLGAHAGTK